MEDKIIKDELYQTVMKSFVKRIEMKKLAGKK